MGDLPDDIRSPGLNPGSGERRTRSSKGWWSRLLGVVGARPDRRPLLIEGVRYIRLDAHSYEVSFPGGDAIRIRPRDARVFDDLGPDPRREAAAILGSAVRPGSRVLVLGAGTGAAGRALAETVGPTGAVVSLEEDGESVRFARRRYPDAHCAHEIGNWRTLRGEIDGSFDAALVSEPREAAGEAVLSREHLGELERVLSRSSRVAIASGLGLERARSVCAILKKSAPSFGIGTPRELASGWGLVTAERGETARARKREDGPDAGPGDRASGG